MSYHAFWILYALATGGVIHWSGYDDCIKYGEITKQEVQYVGQTCYRKDGEKWVVAK